MNKKQTEHKCVKCIHLTGPFTYCEGQVVTSQKIPILPKGHRLIITECTGYEPLPQEKAA